MPQPAQQHARTLDAGSAINCVKYNASGNYILSGGKNRLIDLWNPNTGTHIKSYAGHGYQVLDIDSAGDSRTFVSCGGDRAVFFWDVAGGRTIRRYHGHLQRVNAVAISEDANLIFSGSFDATLRVWDCRSNSNMPIQIFDDAHDSITGICKRNDSIISASADGFVRTYDCRQGLLITDCVGAAATNVVLSTDGQTLLVSSLDSAIRLIDCKDGKLLQSFVGHVNQNYRIRSCFAVNDTYVVTGSEDGRVCAWHLISAEKIWDYIGHNNNIVTAVISHPSKNQLISTGQDGLIQVFE